jgi:TolB protein
LQPSLVALARESAKLIDQESEAKRKWVTHHFGYSGSSILRLIIFLTLAPIPVACDLSSTPSPAVGVQTALPTPTPEPTFTPSPPPTDTPQPTPTATPAEPTPMPTPQSTLSGNILDQATNQPISGAKVSVGTATATTDADGRYSLTGMPPSQYVLSVTHPDYDPGLSSIFTLAAGQELSLDLALYAPDTSPYPKDPMLTNPLDPNGAPTAEDAERLARLQGLAGEVANVQETKLTGEYLVNYKTGEEVRAAVAELNHEVWELTDDVGRKWWIIKVCGNLASPSPTEVVVATPRQRPLPPMAEVSGDDLIVRACASEECAEAGTIQRGVRVEVIGCLADKSWCQVGLPGGGTGWCTGQSLRHLAVAQAVSVVGPVLPTATLESVAVGEGKIAFVSNRDDNGEIYVVDADGSGLTRLTNHPAWDSSPSWSPDGRQIAFTSDRDGNSEVYLMNADGSGLMRLTNHPRSDVAPTWSPDGHYIAFISSRDGNPEVYVMNVDGSSLIRLTNHVAEDWSPTWSPDGLQIAFTSSRDDPDPRHCGEIGKPTCNWDIYVMKADGSGVTRLTNLGSVSSPAWSPDGSKIAFDYDLNVYVINADGSGLARLTDRPANDLAPSWSPDGLKIAFQSVVREPNDSHEVYIMDADGSNVIRLTNHPAWDGTPAWSR